MRHYRFNHGVPVNKIYVVMSCLYRDGDNLVKLFSDFHFRGIAMSFSIPGITTQNTARDKMIKTCDAYVA